MLKLMILTATLLSLTQVALAQSGARSAGYLYLSPVPGAPYVSTQTRYVLVRFENITPAQVTNLTTSFISVTGANSGPHLGATHIASDGRTVIFEMFIDFSQNELVTVTLNPQVAPTASGAVDRYQYQFMITAPFPGSLPVAALSSWLMPGARSSAEEPAFDGPVRTPEPAGGNTVAGPVIKPNRVAVPGDFPTVVITVNSNPSPGYLFLESGVSLPQYTMMLDNDGFPVWYRRGRMYDFKVQKNGLITWCVDPSDGGFTAFDQDFNYVRTYRTTNGYLTDGHELKVLEDGTYLILGYRLNIVDMSKYVSGGNTSATVRETVIQQFTAADELIFQWRAWDNYDIRLSGTDFPHMNSLDIDLDGHILVSARHLSEVTKINRDTGEIIWRLSGTNSTFTFVHDSLDGTSYQHNISALGNGRYMVFDNGNTRSPLVSRAVEYRLDLTNRTATLVWQFRDAPDKYASWLGSSQRLPTGNTLINFARPEYPKAIEVDSSGTKHFELSLVPNSDAYRAFRFPWNGAVAAPYLIAEPQADNVALVFNKFGDHTVDHYRIYGGTSPAPTTLLATSTATLKHLTNVVNGVRNYFRATAVSTNGVESDYSNEEEVLVNMNPPGQNMVLNGDFSNGAAAWTWEVTPPASAVWDVADGISHFEITDGGIYTADVQLKQAGMNLIHGQEYVFEFDAWSAAPRVLEAKVEGNAEGGIDYSAIQPFTITPVTNHYSFRFIMTDVSDNNAQVVFNVGALPLDVYLDNVSLRERVYTPGDFDSDDCVGFNDLRVFAAQWQKSQRSLRADLNLDGKVDFADFVLFSKSWFGQCPKLPAESDAYRENSQTSQK